VSQAHGGWSEGAIGAADTAKPGCPVRGVVVSPTQ
jgi:hypothetical protein